MNPYNMGVDISAVSDAVIGYGLVGIVLLCIVLLWWAMWG